jgi:hypothetical protein
MFGYGVDASGPLLPQKRGREGGEWLRASLVKTPGTTENLQRFFVILAS